MSSKETILITGGAGFIGSNLCEHFVNKGFHVVCLDNFSTGKISNIEALLNNKNFKLIEGDIRKISDCQKAIQNCNYVLHQAALGSVPRSINDPITTNEVNISGFLNMLNVSKDAGVKRFVFAASSSTYGDSEKLPKVENIIGNPLSPYAVSKYVNELYANVFHKIYGIETIGLRYFNVFGRKQDYNSVYAAVIPKFINLFLQLKSPQINGDGTNSRDFTYIDNVIQMNELALFTENKDAIGNVFNTAVGEQTSLNQMVDLLKKYLSNYIPEINNVPIIYGDQRSGDVLHSLASIDKAKNILGYSPSHSFINGLKESIAWYVNSMKDE